MHYCLDNKIIDLNQEVNNSDYLKLLNSLDKKSPQEISEISLFFRNDYIKCKQILEKALNSELAESIFHNGVKTKLDYKNDIIDLNSRENILIHILGLEIYHKKDFKNLLNSLSNVVDKRLDLLRGMGCLELKQYEDAELYFSKISYKKGIEICSFLKNKKSETKNEIIKCYFNSCNWDNFEGKTNNLDFLFRIGKSKKYFNKDNIDVQLTLLDQKINNVSNNLCKIRDDLCKLCGDDDTIFNNTSNDGLKSPEIYYMIGKTYHLEKNYEKAVEIYKKVLLIDSSYEPAQFNLNKILELPFIGKSNNISVSDFNCLIALKNLNFNIDFSHCSELIRKIGYFVKTFRNLIINTSTITTHSIDNIITNNNNCLNFNDKFLSNITILKDYFNNVILENNLAIFYYLNGEKEKSISILNNLILNCSDNNLKEFLNYNLGIFKSDLKILSECSFSEAKIVYDYLNNNINTTDQNLKSYLLIRNSHNQNNDNNLLELKGILDGRKDVFSSILYGCIYIDSASNDMMISMAENIFMNHLNSKYCINGLGICAVMRGKYKNAVEIFKKIIEDFPECKINLGFTYFLMKDFKNALENLLNVENVDDSFYLFLAKNCKELDLIEKLKDKIKGKNENNLLLDLIKARILLDMGKVEEVRLMNLSDPEIVQRLKMCEEKEKERKKKIEEIAEFRKKRQN